METDIELIAIENGLDENKVKVIDGEKVLEAKHFSSESSLLAHCANQATRWFLRTEEELLSGHSLAP